MPEQPACKDCRFFRKIKASKLIGWCRRYPPVRFPDREPGVSVSLPPDVAYEDWCGEWQGKTSKTGEALYREAIEELGLSKGRTVQKDQ